MADFNNYIMSLEKYAYEYGAVKIIPPKSWVASSVNSELDSISFRPTLIDVVHVSDGVFFQTHQRFKKSLSYAEYQSSFKESEPKDKCLDDLEREF
jgi:hypothetical protein